MKLLSSILDLRLTLANSFPGGCPSAARPPGSWRHDNKKYLQKAMSPWLRIRPDYHYLCISLGLRPETSTGATRQWCFRAKAAARCRVVITVMTARGWAWGSGLIRSRKLRVALRRLGPAGAAGVGQERRGQTITHPVGLLPVMDQDAFLEQEV
jgi:hypothetical protein